MPRNSRPSARSTLPGSPFLTHVSLKPDRIQPGVMPHCLRCLLLVPAMLLLSGSPTSAEAQNPSPTVEQFVRVRSPTVILAHVTVIDGTGKPAVGDRNVTIEGGKIIRIEAAGRAAKKEGTTTLDLRGYSVAPGFVGMKPFALLP